jgi:NAD+ diphosphatase
MAFCHRCGSHLRLKALRHIYECEQGHIIYANASPAVAAILLNDKDEALIMARAQEPGKGWLTIPGGFCNGAESVEKGLAREIMEETKIKPEQYGELTFVTSDIDYYDADNQISPVSAIVFTARLKGLVAPQLDEENEWYKFVPLHDIDADKVYSITVRKAIKKLQEQ